MKPPFIRSPYNYDAKKASDDTAYVETLPSLTVQSQALDTDINEIVRRVGIGAPMPVNARIPTFEDYTDVGDFRSALEAVKNAEMNFMQLPASTRAQFDNDPQLFLNFCTSPGNHDQLKALGLTIPEPITPPAAPQAATPQTGATNDPTKK
jgi:hypothetical protein